MKTGFPEQQFIEALKQLTNSPMEVDQTCQKVADFALKISLSDISFVYFPAPFTTYPGEKRGMSEPLLISSARPGVPALSNELVDATLKSWLEQDPLNSPAFFQKVPQNSYPLSLQWFNDRFETFWAIPFLIDKNSSGVQDTLGIHDNHCQEVIHGILGCCYLHTHSPSELVQQQLEILAHFGATATSHSITTKISQQRALQIENLFQISQLLVSGGYLEEILTFVAQTVVQIMNVQVCSIILADEERQIFYFKAIACPDRSYHQLINASIRNFVCGNSYFSRRPSCIPNLKLEKKFADPDLARKYDLYSMLSVPMTCLSKIIGVFNVYTTRFFTFSEQDTHLLQLIANQVASVVHETYLTKEIKKIKRDLLAQKKLQRAKSILMKQYQLSEEDAHRLILRRSMDLRKPILEIADNIINELAIEP
jgi:hypothetical protein